MGVFTFLANFFARFSVGRWNKNRILRKICRKVYRGMGSLYVICRRWRYRGQELPEGTITNTYPWPYRDPRFAPWEEDDRTESYTLITDPANFVIRRSTSYIAWKIFELTGKWPLERGDRSRTFHAKYWQEFLRLNGYTESVEQPERGHHYVGICPEEGEFGQLFWLEDVNAEKGVPLYTVSTYVNFHYRADFNYEARGVTWVKIR